MIIISKEFDICPAYDLTKIGEPDRILFFDIETTGLSAYGSALYLIGAGHFRSGKFVLKQWFAESLRDEKEVMERFFAYAADFDVLLHFNGDTFDIRYLEDCAKQYSMNCPLGEMESVDILKRVRRRKNMFGLENCRQKSLENFLHVEREDRFSGGELIRIYEQYTESRDEQLKKLLLLHNEEDLKGMPEILPILKYTDVMDGKEEDFLITDSFLNRPATRLTAVLKFHYEFPTELTAELGEEINVTFRKDEAVFEISVLTGTLKYFYPNYKDYYYLPKEDTAIHKKLASFVDKAYRKPAKPETCYTKAYGSFLPAPKGITLPVFSEEAKSGKKYVQYDGKILKNYLIAVLKEN